MRKKGNLLPEEVQRKHLERINNPRISENDPLYHDGMTLLVHEKSNWHLYYNPTFDNVCSIAVVPSCESTMFGSLDYFKRWYHFKKSINPDIDDFLTKEAFELLGLPVDQLTTL